MNYKMQGTITTIGETKTLDNGASVLDYVVSETSENGYVTSFSFNIYKKAEHLTHLQNFIDFNKVGDKVEVEFNIKGREYNGRTYNSLSHWRCDKVEATETTKAPLEVESDLPF